MHTTSLNPCAARPLPAAAADPASRRQWLVRAVATGSALVLGTGWAQASKPHPHSSAPAPTPAPATAQPSSASPATPVEVWKDPQCGCCQDWVVHMQEHGFDVTVHDTGNNAVRARLGLPARLGSCHTALVGGYVLEGHVPAREVRALLTRRPPALGLAVPGMPVGSPGMDGPAYGGRRDPYDVLLVARDGSTRVFASYHRSTTS